MVDAARVATDRKLDEMERHLRKLYSRAEKEIGKAWKEYMVEADEKVASLTDAYIKAKAGGDKEAIRQAGKALSGAKQNRTIYNAHYQSLTRQMAEQISDVNEIAAKYINGQLPEIYTLNYNEVAKKVNKQLGGRLNGYSFELVDQRTVRRLATQQENLLPYKYIDKRKDVRWNVQKINSEVTQGILQGESMPKIAKRFEAVMDMDKTSAIRNARTTVTSAENKGRMDMMHEARAKGVIMQKGWSAINQPGRTRDAHLELNNVFVDMDEPFENEIGEIMYPGDPDADPANVYNCRCSLIYKVVGFE